MYEVIVGNIGKVFESSSLRHAKEEYQAWVILSQNQYGRASGEDVILCAPDGEPIKEYIGDNNQEDNFGEIV